MAQRIVVIGAGMAGASIAAELAASAEVTLIEAEDVAGFHATGRSAATYLAIYGNAVIRALTRASAAFLRDPPPGFAERSPLRSRGVLILADADHAHEFDAAPYDRLERLTPDEAGAMLPPLRRDAIVAARFDPDAADLDVDLLHRGYLKLGRARGVTTLLAERVRGATRAGDCWRIDAGAHTLEADVVVNAAGAWADEIAALFGAARIGLSPRRRTMMLLDPPPGIEIEHWPFVLAVDESVYFKPDAGKIALSPADETPVVPGDAQPDELDMAIGVDRFERLMDVPVRRIAHSWAGLRTFAPDRTPVVGYDPQVPGLFWFAGQGGYGIQTAPAMAWLGAALALGAPLPSVLVDAGVDPAPLSPARFATPPESAAQA